MVSERQVRPLAPHPEEVNNSWTTFRRPSPGWKSGTHQTGHATNTLSSCNDPREEAFPSSTGKLSSLSMFWIWSQWLLLCWHSTSPLRSLRYRALSSRRETTSILCGYRSRPKKRTESHRDETCFSTWRPHLRLTMAVADVLLHETGDLWNSIFWSRKWSTTCQVFWKGGHWRRKSSFLLKFFPGP